MRRVWNKIFVVALMSVVSLPAIAQDEITDADLTKYALMQEVITYMKKDISVEINAMIKAQEGMTGQRYQELSKTKGDADKLASVNAEEWEIKFLEQTNSFKEERIEAIKTVNTELATKMVGDKGKTYKAIKDALSNDADVKARYDAIVSAMKPNDA